MSIIVGFNGAQLTKPGAYSKMSVLLDNGAPLSPAGAVGIVGEAVGGAPGSTANEGVQTFYATQMFDITEKYISGPIVDACRALLTPSKDPDIVNGANIVYIYKTNNSTSATATLKNMTGALATMMTMASANYGLDQNNTNVYITEGTATDTHAPYTSGTITFPVTINSLGTLIYNYQGTAYTCTVTVAPGGSVALTQAQLVSVLNGNAVVVGADTITPVWAPANPIVASASGTDKVALTLNTASFTTYATRHDYAVAQITGTTFVTECKFRGSLAFATNGLANGTFTAASTTGIQVGSWTQIEDNDSVALNVKVTAISGSGPYTITVNNGATDISAYTQAQSARIYTNAAVVDPTTLVYTAGNGGFSRGSRGSRIFFIKKNTTLETMPENSNAELFRILYTGAGTVATMTVQDVAGAKKLTTACTGAASDNLNITLSNYTTVQQLIDYINNFNGGGKYLVYTDYYNAGTFSPSNIDYYNTIDILTLPLGVKSVLYDLKTNLASYSQLITATITSNVYGQLNTVASTNRTFLSGATAGFTTNTNIQTGFDALLGKNCNIVVPLFCQDAGADITAGITDASSTYTITSINAMADTHCRTASNTENRSERNCYVSLKDTFANSKLAARLLNSEYASLGIQDVSVLDSTGTAGWKNPFVFSCLCAGMQAGAEIGLPITRKSLNCLGVRHSTFDPRTQYADAITNGLLFAEMPDRGGVSVVVGNTTYQKDSSFVFNRISVLSAAHYTARYLRENLENAFVGKTKAGGTTLAVGIKSYAANLLGTLLRNNILTGDAKNKGLGYRDLVVQVSGNIVTLSVIITPVEGIDFVLADITLAAINDNA